MAAQKDPRGACQCSCRAGSGHHTIQEAFQGMEIVLGPIPRSNQSRPSLGRRTAGQSPAIPRLQHLPAMASNIKVVATNRKARYEYFIEETFEAGLVLRGTEIKSVRAANVSIREAYVSIESGEAFLLGAHIAPYDPASRQNHEPTRPRKLLLHRRELNRLANRVAERGYTIVPLRMYLRRGLAKVEIALAKGKRQYDKRRQIAERDAQRRIERAIADRQD